MAPPLHAGPRLVPPNGRNPGEPPSGKPGPGKPGPGQKPRRRRRFYLFSGLFWPLRLLATVVTIAMIGGLVVGVYLIERDTANLPSLETLRHYQPKLMTRLYASTDTSSATSSFFSPNF